MEMFDGNHEKITHEKSKNDIILAYSYNFTTPLASSNFSQPQ